MKDTSATHTPQSFLSKVYEKLFFANRKLGVFSPKDDLDSYLAQKRVYQAEPYTLPKLFLRFSTVSLEQIEGMPVVIFSPRYREGSRGMIYFHGGAYVEDPTPLHFHFIDSLLNQADFTVYMPVYPKTPTYDAPYLFPRLEKVIQDLLQRHGDPVIAGDSAGGGLALAATAVMNLTPKHLVLISPWLDLHLSNPDIVDLEESDPLLSREYLREMGRHYKGSLEWDDVKVSPFNAGVDSGTEVTLFVGTHELFLADVRAFAGRLEEEGRVVHYFEQEGMNHDYVLFPMKEGTQALEKIVEIIGS